MLCASWLHIVVAIVEVLTDLDCIVVDTVVDIVAGIMMTVAD